ncbi:TetR/AcrR family transcriptional regulator C-terminal domain-containing protein [Fodinicola feengrottensis]|uniref:TetR/AcrR family transcriptional regulator C-terminal domain-containing protein n=1 Tax=Fodinicola feengrottensis TaxID=435914 RepID=A0ABN2GF73_9ACTN
MVIWMRPERASRGPRPAHSRTEIALACVRVADAEGIDAVSMRRVAAELGTGTTSLYRYVSSKDDLYDVMVDAVLGEEQLPIPTGYWVEDLRQLASWKRARFVRHPWMATVSGRPAVGPCGLVVQERSLRAVDGLQLPIDEMYIIAEALDAYVQGFAMREVAEQWAIQRSGLDAEAWMDAHAAYAQAVMASGDFPLISRMWLDASEPHAADRAERGFQHGLDRLLEGFGASIRRSHSPGG